MKDVAGIEVNIGDTVATSALCNGSTSMNRRAMTVGIVIRMTGKGCEIDYNYLCSYPSDDKPQYRTALVITQPYQTALLSYGSA